MVILKLKLIIEQDNERTKMMTYFIKAKSDVIKGEQTKQADSYIFSSLTCKNAHCER